MRKEEESGQRQTEISKRGMRYRIIVREKETRKEIENIEREIEKKGEGDKERRRKRKEIQRK